MSLLLVLKTVGKATIVFISLSKGGLADGSNGFLLVVLLSYKNLYYKKRAPSCQI